MPVPCNSCVPKYNRVLNTGAVTLPAEDYAIKAIICQVMQQASLKNTNADLIIQTVLDTPYLYCLIEAVVYRTAL